jgi:hypothetical protein
MGYGSIAPSGGGERSIRTGVRAVVAATAFLAVASVIAVVSLSGQEGTVRGPVSSHSQCRGGEEDLWPANVPAPASRGSFCVVIPSCYHLRLECGLVSYEMGRERGRERDKRKEKAVCRVGGEGEEKRWDWEAEVMCVCCAPGRLTRVHLHARGKHAMHAFSRPRAMLLAAVVFCPHPRFCALI